MAPAPTATANRPMAQPSKTRYFKGKAPELAPESDSDEDNDDQEEIQLTKPKFKAATKVLPIDPSLVAGGAGRVITDVGGIGKAGTGGIGMKMELGGAKIGGPQIFSKPGMRWMYEMTILLIISQGGKLRGGRERRGGRRGKASSKIRKAACSWR